MKPIVAILALCLAAAPLHAEDSDVQEGMDLLSQGTQLLLRGLMSEVEPALKDLEGALSEMEGMLGDLSAYHAPEVLPNGDILIRRKQPKPGADNPEIDL